MHENLMVYEFRTKSTGNIFKAQSDQMTCHEMD